jgi:hypothetical protein
MHGFFPARLMRLCNIRESKYSPKRRRRRFTISIWMAKAAPSGPAQTGQRSPNGDAASANEKRRPAYQKRRPP